MKTILNGRTLKLKEIIKEGQTKYITTCNTCGCQFSYELSDISFNSIDCPFCYKPVNHDFYKNSSDAVKSVDEETSLTSVNSNDYACCGTCTYMDTSLVFTSNPPKFRCRCTSCDSLDYVHKEDYCPQYCSRITIVNL